MLKRTLMEKTRIYDDIKSMEKNIQILIRDFIEKHGPLDIHIETEQTYAQNVGNERSLLKNNVTVNISN